MQDPVRMCIRRKLFNDAKYILCLVYLYAIISIEPFLIDGHTQEPSKATQMVANESLFESGQEFIELLFI
jgi:hypothetical protein